MKHRYQLNIVLTVFVFFILFITNAILCLALTVLYLSGVIEMLHLAPLLVIVLSLIISVILSTVLSGFVIRHFFRPLRALTLATRRVTAGDFDIHIREDEAVRTSRIVESSELGALIRSFNAMTRELRSVEIFRQDFISNFSHEFKTPILSIRGFARQLTNENLTPEQQREYARIIVDESEHLSNMSANILLLTKLENQKIVTDHRPFQLDEQLRNCMLLFESAWSEKDLQLEMELEEIVYSQNEDLLFHVWNNLISNAVKFTPPGGKITVWCHRTKDGIHVCIRDNGPGMSPEVLSHMYEKFYQGDPSRKTQGNGLGLALVRRIIDLIGARIRCESHEGRGTSFTVTLRVDSNTPAISR